MHKLGSSGIFAGGFNTRTFCFADVNFKQSTIMVKKFQYISIQVVAVLITASVIRYRETFKGYVFVKD